MRNAVRLGLRLKHNPAAQARSIDMETRNQLCAADVHVVSDLYTPQKRNGQEALRARLALYGHTVKGATCSPAQTVTCGNRSQKCGNEGTGAS